MDAPDKTQPSSEQPLKTIKGDKLIGWFIEKVKSQAQSGDGPQLNMLKQLTAKNKGEPPSKGDLVKAISELPNFKGKYQIEGFGQSAGQPQPPSKSSSGQGLITKGNIALDNRPVVKNQDGTSSTVSTITIEEDGHAVLLPTIVNGKRVSEDEAVKHYHDTGEHMGIFKTEKDADEYDRNLHNQMGWNGPEGSSQDKWQHPRSIAGKVFDVATTNVSGEGRGMRVMEHNANLERMKKAESEGKPYTPTERYVAQTFEDVAGLEDAAMSPLGMITAGLGPKIRVLAKAKDAGKIITSLGWGEKFARIGFSAAQATAAGKAALDWFGNPSPESAAKMIDSGALSLAVMGPEIKSTVETIGRVPGAVAAGAKGFVHGYKSGSAPAATEAPAASETPRTGLQPQPPGLPAGTPPKQLGPGPAPGLPEDFLRSVEKDAQVPRDRIGILNKLSTEDMLKRVEYYNQRLAETPSTGKAGGHGTTEGKVQGVRSTLQNERTAVQMLLKQRGIQQYDKAAPGVNARVRTPDTDLVPSGSTAVARRPQEQPQPPAPGSPRQIGQPQPPAGLLPEGQSAYFQEHPQIYEDARISRQEANALAQRHGVSPNSLLKLSEHSNEELVGYAKQLQTLRRAVINHPGDMMPKPEGTGGYPVHKQEFVDQLNRNIEAIESMLLHTKRSQASASSQPQPPPAATSQQPQPPPVN